MNSQPNHRNVTDRQGSAGFSLDDVYYTVFRHKKLLLVCLCLGMISTGVVRSVLKPVYSSHAKLFVRYILDRPEINPENQDARMLSAGSGNSSILSSEREILASLDIAKQVAETVGPSKILAKISGGNDLRHATSVVRSGISVGAVGQSDVMVVSFDHPDSEVVQPVLEALIQAYLLKHHQVRQGTLFNEDHYSKQLAILRNKLAETEEALKKVLSEAGVISIAEAKRTLSTQIEKIKGDLLEAKAQLYAREAVLSEDALSTVNTNLSDASVSTDKLDYYATILAGLNELRKRERDLLLKYTEAHPLVTAARESMAQLKKKKTELEAEDASLALHDGGALGGDLTVELAQLRALKSRINSYETLINQLQAEALSLLDVEPRIAELEREREQEAKNLAYVSLSLDRARSEEGGGSRVTGINVVENPTPPAPNDKKRLKLMGVVFGGFLGFGVGIAVLVDFVLDRTIKRSVDVRRHMRLPCFLAIPNTGRNDRFRPLGRRLRKPPTVHAANSGATNQALVTETPPWDANHPLRLYAEGLRERLITHFEINNITHVPKLVGVSGCNNGSGVTTLASGLAAALSKIGDGNVLLVDMNLGQGEAHAFHGGKPGCALANIADPESQTSDHPPEIFYLASSRAGTNNRLAKVIPTGFTNLVTSLKASDYDYIIFDLPSVTPLSVTPRLASYMDVVLLVVESERTRQLAACQASELMRETRANVSVVLNKCRQHVPSLLSQEL